MARFHVLISAMLSSQTKDPINAAAMRRLLDNGSIRLKDKAITASSHAYRRIDS